QVPVEEDTVEFHTERTDDPDVLLPSRRRRVAVIVLYVVALTIAYDLVLTRIDPAGCARDQSCVGGTRVAVEAAALIWLGLSVAAIVAGWKGLLFGARLTRQVPPHVSVGLRTPGARARKNGGLNLRDAP